MKTIDWSLIKTVICSSCGIEKDVSLMKKERRQCLDCIKQINRNNYLKRQEERKAIQRKYYQEHKLQCIEYNNKYYEENKEKIKSDAQTWKKENPKKMHEISAKRWSLQKKLDKDFTNQDKIDVLNNFNHQCFKCHNDTDLTIDHHFPLSMNIPLTKQTAVVLCHRCNTKKSIKHPNDWYTIRERFALKKLSIQ